MSLEKNIKCYAFESIYDFKAVENMKLLLNVPLSVKWPNLVQLSSEVWVSWCNKNKQLTHFLSLTTVHLFIETSWPPKWL